SGPRPTRRSSAARSCGSSGRRVPSQASRSIECACSSRSTRHALLSSVRTRSRRTSSPSPLTSCGRRRGPGKTMRVFCCEKDHHNYALLAENLRPCAPHDTLMPSGGFERHVPEIAETIGNSPALVLLDPIGVATIPADAWEPLLVRPGKTDLFIVLHFAGVHRLRGWMLPDGSPNPAIEGARAGVLNM